MDDGTRHRVAALAGRGVLGAERVVGGYTPAERWRVHLDGGVTAFAKVGATPYTARELRLEGRRYPHLGRCAPALLGFEDHPERPLLLLEDLPGRWPPPWAEGDVQRVLELLARVATLRPPDLPPLEDPRATLAGWTAVAQDPAPFLSLGMVSSEWLAHALPVLLRAQDAAELAGDELLHLDVRSDNLCLLPDRAVLVDWNHAARGNAAVDRAFWAPSLRLEGGPPPEALVTDPALAAIVAGWFAARAGLPEIPDAPRVRWIQRRQLRIALPWACRALGLPPPDRSWARAEEARLDRALAAGEIDRATWFAQSEEALIDAYLATDDPRRMSGKTGDELDWRWSRELVLDAAPRDPCHVLDVGCANGYLMESLARWGAERGLTVEPYGLEISDRMARVARGRLPRWADRIAVGNVVEFAPGRGYDLVHLALDMVPSGERRALIQHARTLLAPGGRIVLRPDRVGGTEPDPVQQLRALGFEPGGVLEAVHPLTGALRRTAWLQ